MSLPRCTCARTALLATVYTQEVKKMKRSDKRVRDGERGEGGGPPETLVRRAGRIRPGQEWI